MLPLYPALIVLLSVPSRWSNRTEKRRKYVQTILDKIVLPNGDPIKSINPPILQSREILWDNLDPILDPCRGGSLDANSSRGVRKRLQIEAFCHVVSSILESTQDQLVVDAASGAGNLAIGLAGILGVSVCAIDVNELALCRLAHRANRVNPQPDVTTICKDLAIVELPNRSAFVTSLHGCGASSDLAIQLATQQRLPFCVSPCCTAKAVVPRSDGYTPSASFQRSAAPKEILYPRSKWLQSQLGGEDGVYDILAKIADIGLGPQTPAEQVLHQQVAKHVVEIDRMQAATEDHDYSVRLLRLRGHDFYGKSELLVGAPSLSRAAYIIQTLPTSVSQ